MKKFLLTCFMVSIFLLVGCFKEQAVDQASLEDMFDDIAINLNAITASSVTYENNVKIDRMEAINFNHPNGIHLQLILSSENPAVNRDVEMLITKDYIYTTEGMKKRPHQMDIDNLSDVWQFIENYFVLIQENQYNTLIIKELSLSLLQPRVNISANYNILRGQSSNQSDVPSDQVNMIEIAFTNTSILELHLKREYMFDSTKGQSNYVFGTHYYFGEPPFSDFPSLNDFSID